MPLLYNAQQKKQHSAIDYAEKASCYEGARKTSHIMVPKSTKMDKENFSEMLTKLNDLEWSPISTEDITQ